VERRADAIGARGAALRHHHDCGERDHAADPRPDAGDPAALLRPAADNVLRVWPMARAVNSPRNNGPELLAPVVETP